MNRSDDNDLLKDVLNTDADRLRTASLEHVLAAVHRRNRKIAMARRTVVAGGILAIIGFAAALAWNRATPTAAIREIASPRIEPEQDSPAVQVISDEELFALFPDRPAALIGKPGQQRLVFLDSSRRVAGRL